MKKWFLIITLLAVPIFFSHLAVAQKTDDKASEKVSSAEMHKDYADMKIAECNECHKGEGIAPNHGADWLREHRILATAGDKNCSACHKQSFCLDCHQGGGIDAKLSTKNYRSDYVPKSHRSDYLEIHPLKAKDNPQQCYRCHDQKYCSQCHSKFRSQDTQFLSHRRQFSDISLGSIGSNHANFTPDQCQTCHPGGNLPSHGQWVSDHAREARRNLQSCRACHSDGDVCMKCHSARTGSGLRVSPHPRNWGSIKNNYRDAGNSRTCLKCHDATDPLLR